MKTDNDLKYFPVKVKLRQDIINTLESVMCLECFAGDGLLWQEIKKANPDKKILVLRIDEKEDKKGVYLKGDNLKFIKSINLSQFNIIDLDAYGVPVKQLEVLFDRKYQGWVVVTFIQSMTGQLSKQLLRNLGYSDTMMNKAPSLFNKNGFEKMKRWLSGKGVKTISYFSENRKNYFSFYLTK